MTGVCNWRYGATCSSSLTVEASANVIAGPRATTARLAAVAPEPRPMLVLARGRSLYYLRAHVLGPPYTRSSRIHVYSIASKMAAHNGTYVRTCSL